MTQSTDSQRTIILPLDGSVMSDRAVGYARLMATSIGARVVVLHVFKDVRDLRHCVRSEIEWGAEARPRGEISPPPSIIDGCRWIEETVDDVLVVGRCGVPADEILAESSNHSSPLIVMASLGSTGFRRVLMGSVATEVVRSGSFPVTIIPSRSASAGFAEPAIERISVLMARSTDVHVVAPLTVSIAKGLRRPVDFFELVDARSPGSIDPPASQTEVDDTSREPHAVDRDIVRELRDALGDDGVAFVRVAYGDDQIAAIARYVDERKIGLIVTATSKRSLLERLTYQSVSDDIAGALPAPVLVVPAGSDGSASE